MIKPSLADWVLEDWSQITESRLKETSDKTHANSAFHPWTPCSIPLPCRYPGNLCGTCNGETHSYPKYPFLLLVVSPDKNWFLIISGTLFSFPNIHALGPILLWALFPYKINLFQCLSGLTLCKVEDLRDLSSEKQAQPMKWKAV